ncbi:MAG: hypothetical protein AB7S26_29335 [Sandaracinaceae bacterium]
MSDTSRGPRGRAGSFEALALFAVAACTASAGIAHAQWTLPQGQLVLNAGYDFQYADSEFFGQTGEARRERSFPLNGQFFGSQMTFDARLGLTDDLEVEVLVPLRVVAYTSDPVLLLQQPMDSPLSSLDFYQQNIIELSQATAGLADMQFVGRYRFLPAPFLLTGELRLKVPGGYAGPQGTFGSQPVTGQALLDNIQTVVTPANVSDDVTLGDGQVDVIARLLAGAAFDTGTFVAGDVAYNARFEDAGHQLLASVRAGQFIEGIVLLFAGASFGISVTEGRVIGVSVAAIDPELPADQYGGLNNLMLREVRLQRDFLDVYGGVIFRLSPEVELKLAYARTVWGRNTAAVSTFSIAVGARTTLFEPPAPEPLEEELADEEPAYEEPAYEAPATAPPADEANTEGV